VWYQKEGYSAIASAWYAIIDRDVHYYTREEVLDSAGRLGF
jgi:hypothetical protein